MTTEIITIRETSRQTTYCVFLGFYVFFPLISTSVTSSKLANQQISNYMEGRGNGTIRQGTIKMGKL